MAAAERTIEDRLREEYFALLPEISRVAERLEAEIRYLMLPISGGLRGMKDWLSNAGLSPARARWINRRRQETRDFDTNRSEIYTLTSLNDLAGVRVLGFPRNLLAEVDRFITRGLRLPDLRSCPSRRRSSGTQVLRLLPSKR